MSVKLFRIFVNTLRQNLPVYSKTGRTPVASFNPVRFIAAMDTEQKEPNETIVNNKNHTRYKKRYMKRQWDDMKRDEGETALKKLCDENGERIKRKKMAMLLGYCGVDYYGMQRNPGVRTIEEDLLKALKEANYITEEDFNNQQNAQFQRSSRTDKGVSAARQIVSMKLPLEVNIEEINKRLPDCIRVFGVKRVTNKFNSKTKCNARSYSYTLPTYVFEPSLTTEEERKKYRISPEKLEQVANVLSVYKGTKSYHNFTEKKHHQDPSSSRYMMGFKIEKVFVESDMEFAVLLVKGQSFMLHQIRKMVGLMIAVVRGHTDMSIMDKVFAKEKVMIPTAPGLGLVLDKVHYDRYDTKFKNTHDSLTWDAEEETVQKFKHEHIYPNIIKGEIEEKNMELWLEKLSQHSYDPADTNADPTADKDAVDNPAGDDDDDDDTVQNNDDDTAENDTTEAVVANDETPAKPSQVEESSKDTLQSNGAENDTTEAVVTKDVTTAEPNIKESSKDTSKDVMDTSKDVSDKNNEHTSAYMKMVFK